VFRKVIPSVVVIRAKGNEVTSGGQTRFLETGSGVLISTDGKLMGLVKTTHGDVVPVTAPLVTAVPIVVDAKPSAVA
jgi:hypothetical protein